MPLNTRIALDDIRASVTRGVSTVTSQVSNLNPENITRSIDDARAAATSAATSALSNANTFIAETSAGIDDIRSSITRGDRATDTPSPSTIQATNSSPTGSTSPSLAGRQTSTFSTISPRPYFRIDPLDNRYDFLTGQKINTIRGNPNVAAPPPAYPGGNTTGGTGAGGSAGSTQVTNETFYNDFGDSYTQEDIDSVEALRSFNEDLNASGSGATGSGSTGDGLRGSSQPARARLTAGERAYAVQQGYISG